VCVSIINDVEGRESSKRRKNRGYYYFVINSEEKELTRVIMNTQKDHSLPESIDTKELQEEFCVFSI